MSTLFDGVLVTEIDGPADCLVVGRADCGVRLSHWLPPGRPMLDRSVEVGGAASAVAPLAALPVSVSRSLLRNAGNRKYVRRRSGRRFLRTLFDAMAAPGGHEH